MTLKLLGYWSEPDCDRMYPDPKDLVDPNWHPDLRERIADYLRRGVFFRGSWGYSNCRFEGGPAPQEMGSKDLTDGMYVWPEGLHVYIARYNVVLPEEFVSHTKECGFSIAPEKRFIPKEFAAYAKSARSPASTPLEIADVDHDYWIQWAEGYVRSRR